MDKTILNWINKSEDRNNRSSSLNCSKSYADRTTKIITNAGLFGLCVAGILKALSNVFQGNEIYENNNNKNRNNGNRRN